MRTTMLVALAALLAAPAAAQIPGAVRTQTDETVESLEGKQVTLWHVEWQFGLSHTFYILEDGREVAHGKMVRFVEGSHERDITTYRHGVRHGPFTTLDAETRPISKGAYRNGVLQGDVTFFYRSGEVKRVERYRDGTLEGPYRMFHENGSLREEGRFVAGQKEGPVAGYHPNGELAYRGTFRDGYLNGPFQVFDRQGRLRAKALLDEEWIVGEWHCFAPDGTETLVRSDCDQEYYTRCTCP